MKTLPLLEIFSPSGIPMVGGQLTISNISCLFMGQSPLSVIPADIQNNPAVSAAGLVLFWAVFPLCSILGIFNCDPFAGQFISKLVGFCPIFFGPSLISLLQEGG